MREWAWQGRSVWLECGEWLNKQGEAKSSCVLWAKTINFNCILIAMGRHWRDLIRGVAWFDLHFWKFARLACRKWATCRPMMETGKWVRRLLQYSCWEKMVLNKVVSVQWKWSDLAYTWEVQAWSLSGGLDVRGDQRKELILPFILYIA